MDLSILTSLLGAGQSQMQSAMAPLQTYATMKAQHGYNMELADYNFNKNFEMWNKSNEYNSPAAQMQRYKEAGLNPALAISGGNPGNTATTVPQRNQNPMEIMPIVAMLPDVLSKFQDYRLKEKQSDLMQQNWNIGESRLGIAQVQNSMEEFFANLARPDWSFEYEGGQSARRALEKLGIVKKGESIGRYGIDIQKSDLDIKEVMKGILKNRESISESEANWMLKKWETMRDTNVNIDQDDYLYRVGSDVFQEVIGWLKGMIRGKISSGIDTIR